MMTFGTFEAAVGAGTSSAVPAAPPLEQPQLHAEASGRPLRKRQRQNGPKSNANMSSANQEVNIILMTEQSNLHCAIQGGGDIPQNLERDSRPSLPDIIPDLPKLIAECRDHPEQQNKHNEEPDGLRQPPEPEVAFISQLEDLQTSQEFIDVLKAATLDNGGLDKGVLQQLHQPLNEPLDASDPDLRLSLDLFLSCSNVSEETYHSSRAAILCRHPDDKILSYAQIKSKIAELSNVIPIIHHLCINSCAAFTGPFSNLAECLICHEACYIGETESPRREFHTIPIGPQLQALWRTEEGTRNI